MLKALSLWSRGNSLISLCLFGSSPLLHCVNSQLEVIGFEDYVCLVALILGLLIVRNTQPRFQFIVMNRRNTGNVTKLLRIKWFLLNILVLHLTI